MAIRNIMHEESMEGQCFNVHIQKQLQKQVQMNRNIPQPLLKAGMTHLKARAMRDLACRAIIRQKVKNEKKTTNHNKNHQ